MLAAVIVILATGVLVSLIELRWGARINRTIGRRGFRALTGRHHLIFVAHQVVEEGDKYASYL